MRDPLIAKVIELFKNIDDRQIARASIKVLWDMFSNPENVSRASRVLDLMLKEDPQRTKAILTIIKKLIEAKL